VQRIAQPLADPAFGRHAGAFGLAPGQQVGRRRACGGRGLDHRPAGVAIVIGAVLDLGGAAKVEPGLRGKGIDRLHHKWPVGVIVIARDQTADLHLARPVPDRLAAFLAGMGVAVDIDEIETFILEQIQRLGKGHAQQLVGPDQPDTAQRLLVLRHIMGIGIHVDTEEGGELPRLHHAGGKPACGNAQFHPDQTGAALQQAQHIVPGPAIQRAGPHARSLHFSWVLRVTARVSRLPTTLSNS